MFTNFVFAVRVTVPQKHSLLSLLNSSLIITTCLPFSRIFWWSKSTKPDANYLENEWQQMEKFFHVIPKTMRKTPVHSFTHFFVAGPKKFQNTHIGKVKFTVEYNQQSHTRVPRRTQNNTTNYVRTISNWESHDTTDQEGDRKLSVNKTWYIFMYKARWCFE